MSDVTVSQLKANLASYLYNPAGLQRTVLAALQTATDGDIELVDPTNPVVFTLEAAAVLTAAFMEQNAINTRRQYPALAQSVDEVYLHMSDRDYIGRFATPAKTTFCLLLPMTDVVSRLVTDTATGIKKIVIPRNTYFTVADTIFSLQYPIEIRQMAHGGLQVVYDVDVVSPLQALPTNVVKWEIRQKDGLEYLYMEFEVSQFFIDSQTGSVTSAQDFKTAITMTDAFYYARVYLESSTGAWQEIYTTHSDQVYDPTRVTAVLQVVDNILNVRLPQIYTSGGQLSGTIRIDVYQTKGPVSLDLSNYGTDAFTTTFLAIDTAEQTIFTAPLKVMPTILAYSDQVVDDGQAALDFLTLREQVIRNAIGAPELPITNVQLESDLIAEGYQAVANVDNVTNRVFLATRAMPAPDDEQLLTAAAASVQSVLFNVDDAVAVESVIDNGDSITITPNTVYRIQNGVTSLVPTGQVQALEALSIDQRALQISAGNYLYTPFHYVLDVGSEEFKIRPYYLDAPVAVTKLFVADNDTTLLQVATKAYGIARTATGYRVQVITDSGDAYKALADDTVFVQLGYVPQGERDRAYVQGVLQQVTDTGERVYNFDLDSTFHVSTDDGLEFTPFQMYSTEPRKTLADLQTDFDLVYSTSAVMGAQWQANAVDLVVGKFQLPARNAGIAHEKLRLRFGYALKTLWSRARSVVSSLQYQTYTSDVPRRYVQDVYQLDSNGSAVSIVNGAVHTTILHHAGDPVLDSTGQPVYQHRAGDVILDGEGQPIPVNTRAMQRQVELMLVEGVYRFATDSTTTAYRSKMVRTVLSWLTNDLQRMSEKLLEQTNIYFYPKTTLGSIQVMIGSGVTTSIDAGQSFVVTLYVDGSVYANEVLRKQLVAATVRSISTSLQSARVSGSAMVAALRGVYGDDVIDVLVTGLGGAGVNLQALTVLDEGQRCSIRKRLVAQADDTLAVSEDVTVLFIRHELPG